MDRDLRATAQRLLTSSTVAVVVEVSAASGSVPREAGTRMLVTKDEAIGTIGGGHLELKALATAREMLAEVNFTPHEQHYPLGPALGQCCGGAVTLGFHRLDDAALERWPTTPPMFHLQLFGAGHVGRAIAQLLATLPVTVDWIDERDDEFPDAMDDGARWPSHIRQVCVDAVEAEVRIAPPHCFHLVLTHDHDLDLRISEAILARGDFAFLGLIGSRTKRQRFVHHFERRGLAAAQIARLRCPIGVEGIGGKAPEVIAIAVVAQLLQAAG